MSRVRSSVAKLDVFQHRFRLHLPFSIEASAESIVGLVTLSFRNPGFLP